MRNDAFEKPSKEEMRQFINYFLNINLTESEIKASNKRALYKIYSGLKEGE